MEALIKLNGSTTIKVEGTDLKDLLEQVTQIDDAVGFEPCGKCKSNNTAPRYRQVEEDKFYEIRCLDCGAVLQLGVNKKGGTLYKKKMLTDDKGKAVKNADGKSQWLPNNGWLKWNRDKGVME